METGASDVLSREKLSRRASVNPRSPRWRKQFLLGARIITKRSKRRTRKMRSRNRLMWFADVAIEAQRRTIALVEFLIDKTKLLDRLKGQLNARQEKALFRMFREGPEGFQGGLSAGKYTSITGASPATTTRDLADLVAKGALVREGERRYARYRLSIPLRPVPHVRFNERGELAQD